MASRRRRRAVVTGVITLTLFASFGAYVLLPRLRPRLRVWLLPSERWSPGDASWVLEHRAPAHQLSYRDALQALERSPGEEAAHCLMKALRHPDRQVRSRSAEILGQWKWLPAFDGLVEAFEQEDMETIVSLEWALGELGDRRAVLALCRPPGRASVYRIHALGMLRDRAAVPYLEEQLRAATDDDSRRRIEEALVLIRDPSAIPRRVSPPSKK